LNYTRALTGSIPPPWAQRKVYFNA